MPKSNGSRLDVILIALFAFISGCRGDEPRLALASVYGKVMFDGQPLEGAKIAFYPVDNRPPSFAVTQMDGSYRLTHPLGMDGAFPGEGMFKISTAGGVTTDAKGKTSLHSAERIPTRYNSRTELSRTIAPGSNNFDFALESTGEVVQEVTIEDD